MTAESPKSHPWNCEIRCAIFGEDEDMQILFENRFYNSYDIYEYDPCDEGLYPVSYLINKVARYHVDLHVYNTVRNRIYPVMQNHLVQEMNAVIFAYDVSSQDSFKRMKNHWVKKVPPPRKDFSYPLHYDSVGTKDLHLPVTGYPTLVIGFRNPHHPVVVPGIALERFIASLPHCVYGGEVCAPTRGNVKECFEPLLQLIYGMTAAALKIEEQVFIAEMGRERHRMPKSEEEDLDSEKRKRNVEHEKRKRNERERASRSRRKERNRTFSFGELCTALMRLPPLNEALYTFQRELSATMAEYKVE